MKFAGTWHIYEMDQWEEEYFNMETQAFITLDELGAGEFQFGLVSGQIDGFLAPSVPNERFEFTWEGSDESDLAAGNGWLALKDADTIQGVIAFDYGDRSTLLAKRV
ncbi:MAG: hypothetical protein MH252_11445 [Thermosynechococcaceae cyanobacterium MS004]|nr:hypothetical protein [Thermosynechococcaceae cyanobacterium MS004]